MIVRLLPLITACGLLASSAIARAGPWTKAQGDGYVKVGESLFTGDGFRLPSGEIQRGVTYVGWQTFMYAEIGLPGGFQVMGYLPWVLAYNETEDTRFLRSSGGDVLLGLQYGLPIDTLPVALRLQAKLPAYEAGARPGPQGTQFPLPGDGQIDLIPWLSAGSSGNGWYGFAEVGYAFRTNQTLALSDVTPALADFADTLMVRGEVGFDVYRGLLVVPDFQAWVPTRDDAVTQGWLMVGGKVYWPIHDSYAIEVSFQDTVWAKNATEGFLASVGLSFNPFEVSKP